MERTTPEVPEAQQTIPADTLAEIRDLFARDDVSVFTTFGGGGFGHTPDREVAEKLTREGWLIGAEQEDGVEREVRIICYQDGIFEMARGSGKTFYSFRIPPALVGLVREMRDAA